MVTSLVPSGKVPSTCTSSSISGTPSITSSRPRTPSPASISSETLRPSRIPSRISAVMSASASGWLSLRPRPRRRRATSAAVKMSSFSCSRGVRCIVEPPDEMGSDRQVLSDHLHSQLSGGARGNHGALGHDHVLVGESLGEVKVLLDQQDGQAELALDPSQRALDLEDDRRLDALGRLVEHEELRLRQERASDREHLLLAARQDAALACQERRERREQLERLVQRGGAPAAEECHAQVLLHGQMGENLAPLRDVADAGARPTVWRPPGDLGAVEAHLPAPRRQESK